MMSLRSLRLWLFLLSLSLGLLGCLPFSRDGCYVLDGHMLPYLGVKGLVATGEATLPDCVRLLLLPRERGGVLP